MEIQRIEGGRPADAVSVRLAVFVDEQGVPEELELDGKDDDATHFVAYDGGRPIGVARLRPYDGDTNNSETSQKANDSGTGGTAGDSGDATSEGITTRERATEPSRAAKVERVAVLADRRGEGIGRELMAAVERAADTSGYGRLVLHAQVPVIPFYERLGYDAVGDTFEKADIPHRRMIKEL